MTGPASLSFCLVSTFYPPYNFGGDGIFVKRLAHGLARRGHSVTVVHSRTAFDTLAATAPDEPYDDPAGVRVIPLRTPLGRWGLLWVHQTGRAGLQAGELARLLDSQPFDIIHYSNVSLLGGVEAFRFGRARKLCTLTDHWLVCPMHNLWRLGRERCQQSTCIRCTLAGRRPPQLWRYTSLPRRATQAVDLFLAPSEFTKNAHRDRGLEGEIVHLPLFHHCEPEGSNSPAVARARPYFLFVGRLEAIKGPQRLLPYFRSHPEYDLLLAGAGDLEPELRRQASANVHVLGRVSQSQLRQLYAGAVATGVPSLCNETFGLVVIESFAAGTPVIVADHSALAELIDRHGGGLKYGTLHELGVALDRLARDGSLRAQLAAQAQLAYTTNFTEETFLDRYLELVASFEGNRSASRR